MPRSRPEAGSGRQHCLDNLITINTEELAGEGGSGETLYFVLLMTEENKLFIFGENKIGKVILTCIQKCEHLRQRGIH